MSHGFQVTFDANDPARLADFWAEALGYVRQPPPPGFDTWEDFATARGIPEEEWDRLDSVVDPDGRLPRLLFQKVPERKVVKNRVHLDIHVGGGPDVDLDERKRRIEAEVARAVAAGATEVARFDEPTGWWVVMQDPEGNEFCLE